MSESKHTPGPWVANSISMENGDVGVSAPDLRISICHVHNAASFGDMLTGAMRRGGGEFRQSDCITQYANARLIAAAPDFANAALLALSALKNADDGDPTNETGWASDESCEAYCALWKALEKAGIDPRTTNPVKIEERAS